MATVTKPMALDETLQATNEILEDIKDSLANSSIVGDTDISEIADGTLTGAVAEFDGEISAINTTLAGLGDAATKDVANTYDAESTDPISGQGVAEALETTEVESLPDTTPYLYRQSPAIGSRVMENALVGASVVVNQLIPNASKDFSNSAIDTRSNLYFYFMSITSPAQVYYYNNILTPTILNILVKPSTVSDGIRIKHNGLRTDVLIYNSTSQALIANHVYYLSINIVSVDPTTVSGIETKNLNLIDLTQWFASDTSIADAAYTKEQSTAGSGIAWLKSQGFDFSKYIAYNTGELCSVNPSAKRVVGFNQWDEVWELGTFDANGVEASANDRIRSKNYIPCFGNTEYYFTCPYYGYIFFYDDGKTFISTVTKEGNTSFDTPSNAKFFRFRLEQNYGTSYKNDVCFNISKPTGTPKNGDYLPYEEHTYPISPSPLRGLYTLVNDTIKASGDVRKSDGSTTRNYDYRAYQSGDESLANAITDGKHTVVKKSTPTTEQLAPFDNPQISIVGGTEKFVTENDVPVGHESEYKKLPPLFEDDYIQTIQERAENVIGEIADITPISGTATVTLLHEEDQGEDWIVGFTGEINGHFDTDNFDYYLTARYTHAYNTNTQILNMNNCTDGDHVNIWQTGTAFDFGVDGGVTVDISVTATKLTFTVNCIGDSIFGIYSSSEPTGTVKYLITPARRG